ncbi:hypothetical protein SI65_01733 [Aspergillus cristatus]|uniref:Protein kinase domain-containing protein n=1 Tax=Aspergillus cristatus TaxID=573508 RepID=A0A1E3BT36_ASPCR|nr:hypothetical protein SI65_01733 [Aspergillus cristatus]
MKEVFACDLAGPVSLAVHRTRPSRVLAVREYSRSNVEKVWRVLQQPQHPNISSATDVFKHDGKLYTIGVDFHLTLDHLVACDVFPCELQLASILAQVVDGLSYILVIGLEHQAIECSNILLGLDGLIQIAALEQCVERRPDKSQAQSLSALTVVTMLLMQKYAKADGAIGIDDIKRWPVESNSVQFLSTTTSVATIEDLKKVGKF